MFKKCLSPPLVIFHDDGFAGMDRGQASDAQRGERESAAAPVGPRKDPDATIAWVNSLPTVDKSNALQNITSQLAQENPAKAAALLASMPMTSQTSYQFSNLASQWAQQDPESAQKWAESLPAGQAQQQALSGIIGNLAQRDPVKAATFFGDTIVTNQNSSQVGMIVGAWVKTDQTAALAWLESLAQAQTHHRGSWTTAVQHRFSSSAIFHKDP